LAKTAGLPVPPRPKGTFKVKGTPEKPVDDPTTMLAVLGISTAKTAEMIEIFVVSESFLFLAFFLSFFRRLAFVFCRCSA
jgi:hypothetical protein